MPGSMPAGKDFTRKFLLDKPIKRILDIGPGSGNYFDLLNCRGEYQGWGHADRYINGFEWVAVEIFEPYVQRFELITKYNRIIISDAYDIEWDQIGTFDVIFLGDVLEHMEESRGREVIRQAVNHAPIVVISLPIVDYPQGPSYGNVHETHVEQYSPERLKDILKDYQLFDSYEGEIVGVYIIGPLT